MIIRKATASDAPAIARVHVDTWRTTYRGIVPDEALANLSYERREQVWRVAAAQSGQGGRGLFVAEDAGQIVGFASGGPERTGDALHKGELYAIYVLQASQGQGIGRLLAQQVGEALVSAELSTMLVWVLAANGGARRFYEGLGGRLVREQSVEVLGVTLPEVAYGWQDLPSLVSRLASR
jgi:ribosomal protein S18 acetylase RimI-like enzyme